MSLAERHCVACRKGTPALDEATISALLPQVPGWALEAGRLVRSYRFAIPAGARALLEAVAREAESEGHHPEIRLTGAGRVLSLSLHTWVAHGLTESDFILAARIDALPEAQAGSSP